MKKLIIAVAAVAMGVSAQAKSAKELDAQVYDFSATVKSTQCKEVKWTKTLATLNFINYSNVKGERVTVRKQASTKIVGVIWGCNCGTIMDPAWRIYPGSLWPTIGGYLFWNPKNGNAFNIATTAFGWALFDRIDDGSKAEGVWALVNDDEDNAVSLLGAGFGKVSGTGFKVGANGNVVAGTELCRPVLSSMSGNFAGFLLSNGDAEGCMFCGNQPCFGIPFCWCSAPNYNPYTALTAAYGTWSIKYNKSVSNKLRKTGLLTQSYSFKSKAANVRALLAKVETAVAEGTLAAADEEDYDDEEWEFDPDEEDVEGELVDKEDVAKYAYIPAGTKEEDVDEAWEKVKPKLFSESDEGASNPIVKALLGIATGDEGDAS